MLDTKMKQMHTKLFLNQSDTETPSHQQIPRPNLRLPLRQQSIKSLHKIKDHYREFQHALNMLKMSVEELWRLELAQLQKHESISPDRSNIGFNIQVPSIYTCRSVLPITSETIQLENHNNIAGITPPLILQHTPATSIQEIISKKMHPEENKSYSITQAVSPRQISAKSFPSTDQKQRPSYSRNNFTKYCKKTALLHLKFRCLKHLY